MSGVGAVVTFAVVWWLVFFMTLPFGATPDENPAPGHVESAPARPRLLLKALIATILAGLLTWAIAWLIGSGLIDLRPQRIT